MRIRVAKSVKIPKKGTLVNARKQYFYPIPLGIPTWILPNIPIRSVTVDI